MMKILIFTVSMLFLLIPQVAYGIEISAEPEKPLFGPNEWIKILIQIDGYLGGEVTWSATQPDGESIDGIFPNLQASKKTHLITRDAFDGQFGTWEIKYEYKDAVKIIDVKVEPLVISLTTDQSSYLHESIVTTKFSTNYYNPIAANAETLTTDILNEEGFSVIPTGKLKTKVYQPVVIQEFLVNEILQNNSFGVFHAVVTYYDILVDIPFEIENPNPNTSIFLSTNRQSYSPNDPVEANIIIQGINVDSGILSIISPTKKLTTKIVPITDSLTRVTLDNIDTSDVGIYLLQFEYGTSNTISSFEVLDTRNENNVDAEEYVLVTQITVGYLPDGVFLNLETDRAYVPNTNINTVSVIDTITNTVIDTIQVGNGPEGMVVNPDTDRAYSANTGSNTVSVIDTITNTVIDTVKVGRFSDTVEVNRDTNIVYVTNEDGGSVSVIDGATNTVTDTISIGGCTIDSSVNPTTNLLYVAGCSRNIATVIDTTTNMVIDTIDVGSTPWSIEAISETNRVYVTNKGSNDVSVIDTTTNMVIDTIDVGSKPFGTTVNTTINRAYVGNTGSNTVSVIDTITNTVIDTIDVGKDPKDIAVNPETNRIYVANSGSNNVSVIDVILEEPGEEEIPIPPESDVMPEEIPELPEQASEVVQNKVPDWVKNNAGWWAEGKVGDSDFTGGIQYLIKEKIIDILDLPEQSSTTAKEAVPNWVKNNAKWWADGLIGEDDFVNGIKYLVEQGIIRVDN